MGVLENLFLVHALPAWHTNTLKRLGKASKLHFLDAGLLAALRDLSPSRLRRDRTPFGPLLETFVFGELLKLAGWSDDRYTFSHLRDKERNEVDIVLEAGSGQVRRRRSEGVRYGLSGGLCRLRRLAGACGDRFSLGLVLYDHDRVVPFGDRMLAVPVSALW